MMSYEEYRDSFKKIYLLKGNIEIKVEINLFQV